MKLSEAQNYVITNARYSEDAPEGATYFVRFPFPYASKIFFSGDTHDLVEKIFSFGKTAEGKELWSKVPSGMYLTLAPDTLCEEPAEESD